MNNDEEMQDDSGDVANEDSDATDIDEPVDNQNREAHGGRSASYDNYNAESIPQQPAHVASTSSAVQVQIAAENNNKGATESHHSLSDDEDGQNCSICMEPWSNSGSHRLCSLRCGHLFGQNCIERWMGTGNHGRCPQCNAKAKVRDIRPLFVRTLKAIDTTERDRLAMELDKVRQEKNTIELELARERLNKHLHKQQVSQLQAELNQLKASFRHGVANSQQVSGTQSQNVQASRFVQEKTVEISREGGCRVLAYNSWMNLIVVSQRSTNPLFPGFGIKKVDGLEFRATQFVFVHPKPIRDLCFHPQRNDLLLSVSLDKCAKLLNVASNSIVQTYNTDYPLWSCCWDATDTNLLYVGAQNGVVHQFDVRNTREPILHLSCEGNSTPVISLVAVGPCHGRAMPRGGILVGSLDSCWSYEFKDGQFSREPIPVDGPLTSLCYESVSNHVLISTRPTARMPHARHVVYQLAVGNAVAKDNYKPICNVIHTFLGGTSQKFLSRPSFLPVNGDIVVAAHQESSSTVALWSVSSGQQLHTIPASDPVIDVCPVKANDNQYLATLSEKVLRIYKAT